MSCDCGLQMKFDTSTLTAVWQGSHYSLLQYAKLFILYLFSYWGCSGISCYIRMNRFCSVFLFCLSRVPVNQEKILTCLLLYSIRVFQWWYSFSLLWIWTYESRINFAISKQSKRFQPAHPQWLHLTVLSSSPSSSNVIKVIHLTSSIVWLNYLDFLWTSKLIPCDFNKLRGEGESLSEAGEWLSFSDASLSKDLCSHELGKQSHN